MARKVLPLPAPAADLDAVEQPDGVEDDTMMLGECVGTDEQFRLALARGWTPRIPLEEDQFDLVPARSTGLMFTSFA